MSIDPLAVTVVEGQSNTYTVVLDTQPTADVTVTVSGHAGTDVSVAPSTLTFTSDQLECRPDGHRQSGPGRRRGCGRHSDLGPRRQQR